MISHRLLTDSFKNWQLQFKKYGKNVLISYFLIVKNADPNLNYNLSRSNVMMDKLRTLFLQFTSVQNVRKHLVRNSG